MHRRENMKIDVGKKLVELTPESEEETKALSALWNLVVDCAKSNKKLVPVGEYVPIKKNVAAFAIED